MSIFSVLKFLLLTLGGLAGLLTVLLSYLLQLPVQEPLAVKDLAPGQQQWFSRGEMLEVLGHQMFTLKQGNANQTLILIHGFPTSSYDYYDVIDQLSQDYTVLVFDHLGFGFSDKPLDYTYSLVDQAEQALALWRHLGIKRAHLVSHDMGDSILTEILSRHSRGMLPEYFNEFFQSVTFTNGGMIYDLINQRLSQLVLNSRLGETFSQLACRNILGDVDNKFRNAQMGSVWSPHYADIKKKEKDIRDINQLNKYKDGNCLMFKTISYLTDRARFEPRWLKSLSHLKIPIQLLWGDSDSVSPVAIPNRLAGHINPHYLTVNLMADTGHFLTLEQPDKWSQFILHFIKER